MLCVEGCLHLRDCICRNGEIIVQEIRDLDGQLVDLGRIMRLHVELDALPVLCDVVPFKETVSLLLQLSDQAVDAVKIEICSIGVEASVVLGDNV